MKSQKGKRRRGRERDGQIIRQRPGGQRVPRFGRKGFDFDPENGRQKVISIGWNRATGHILYTFTLARYGTGLSRLCAPF